jgi:hypothetical protein
MDKVAVLHIAWNRLKGAGKNPRVVKPGGRFPPGFELYNRIAHSPHDNSSVSSGIAQAIYYTKKRLT